MTGLVMNLVPVIFDAYSRTAGLVLYSGSVQW